MKRSKQENPAKRTWSQRLSTFRVKLIFTFSLIFIGAVVTAELVGMFGLPFTAYDGRRGDRRSEAFTGLNLIADMKKDRLMRFFDERRGDANALSHEIVATDIFRLQERAVVDFDLTTDKDYLRSKIRNQDGYQLLKDYLLSFKSAYGIYRSIDIADADRGRVFLSTDDANIGLDVSTKPYFIGVMKSGGLFVSDVFYGMHSELPTLFVSHSITDKLGSVRAILLLEIPTNEVITPMLHTGDGLGKTGEALLVNQDVCILTSLKHPLADSGIAVPLEYRIEARPASLAAAGEEGIIEVEDYRGEPVLAAYRHLRISTEAGWGLVIKRDKSELFAPLHRDLAQSLFVALGCIVILIAIIVIIVGNVTRPLMELTLTARRIAAGNTEVRAPISSTSEFATLASAFNTMIDRLANWNQELESQVSQRTGELSKTNRQLKAEISQRLIIEREIESQNNFLHNVIESLTHPFMVINVEDFSIVKANSVARIQGISEGKKCFEVSHRRNTPCTGEEHPCPIKKVLETNQATMVEHVHFDKDNKARTFEVHCYPLFENGSLTKVIEYSIDITSRKRAEERLKESESRNRAYLSNSPVCTKVVDLDFNLQYMSTAGIEALKIEDVTQLYGKPYPFDFYPDSFRNVMIKNLEKARETGETITQEASVVDIEGNELWYHSTIVPVKDDEGQIDYIMVLSVETTERKRLEQDRKRLYDELIEKNKELEQIVYIASHDLRSPLVNVQGFGKELYNSTRDLQKVIQEPDIPESIQKRLRPLLETEIPENLEFIQSSVTKMDTLLTGLLRYSRTGRAAPNIEKLDMNRLMAAVAADFEYLLNNSRVKLVIEELPDCRGDVLQINQVFSNLLDNAVKYLDPSRPGKIKISGKVTDNKAVYCITDNGRGIAQQFQEKVFEIFHRLDPTVQSGEGLGLSVIKKILSRHDGRIWIESKAGRGSSFYVALPCVPKNAPEDSHGQIGDHNHETSEV